MSPLRGAALGAACLVALTTPGANAILDVPNPGMRVQSDFTVLGGGTGGSQWNGFCGLAATTDPTSRIAPPNVYTGVLFGAVVVAPPSFGTLTCEVRVDGAPVDQATGSGDTVITAVKETQYTATDFQTVEFCTIVTFATTSSTACGVETPTAVPTREVIDLVNSVLELADPTLCAFLRVLDPVSVPGVLDVNDQGDVFLLGDRFYDCPPYGF